MRESVPENTRRALESDWRTFTNFCSELGLTNLPALPETVIEYITSVSEHYATSTISRHLSSIKRLHLMTGHPSPTEHPTAKAVWKGILRVKGRKSEGKSPLMIDHIRKIVRMFDSSLCGTRNKALLLVGFMGGLRRSELANLNVEHLHWQDEGVVLYIPFSKTDQEGSGKEIPLPEAENKDFCPVRALKSWLKLRGEQPGALWLQTYKNEMLRDDRITDMWISVLIKRWVMNIGLDPKVYSGHSMRTGLATSLAEIGVDVFDIQQHLKHAKVETTLHYVRMAERFSRNPLKKIRW